jgi:glutaredoxin
MRIVIYSKNNCPACERAKSQLVLKGVEFYVLNIDTDMDAMDFIAAQGHRSVPQVYADGVHVSDLSTLTSEII